MTLFRHWLLRVPANRAIRPLLNNRGGGSDPQPAQIIPAPPAPDVGETAEQSLQAQLKYNPQLTAQEVALQQQYAPQLALLQAETAAQTAPLLRAILESQIPGLSLLAQQVPQRLASPSSLTADQQSAQDAIRQRTRGQVARNVRESSNIGGTLYGGRRQLREDRALGELEQAFAQEDITRQQQQRQQALQEFITMAQFASPGIQQVATPTFGQGVAPSGNALYSALVQNQGNFGVIQPTAGNPGMLPDLIQGAGAVASAKIMFACVPATFLVDVPGGQVQVQSIRAGDIVLDSEGMPTDVFIKQEYAPAPTMFIELTLEGGAELVTCDAHILEGKAAIEWEVGQELGGRKIVERDLFIRTEPTYDLLTASPDGAYASHGVQVATMIPILHKTAAKLKEVAQCRM